MIPPHPHTAPPPLIPLPPHHTTSLPLIPMTTLPYTNPYHPTPLIFIPPHTTHPHISPTPLIPILFPYDHPQHPECLASMLLCKPMRANEAVVVLDLGVAPEVKPPEAKRRRVS